MVKDSSEATELKFKQQDVKSFCELVINRWQLMRPNINFSITVATETKDTITQDPRLINAIINLLNNAADASPNNIKIDISGELNELVWKITDFGQGINQQLNAKIGKTIHSTKEQGMGIGMLLTHATIKNYGGQLTQTPNQPFGTITELRLPLTA